MPLSSDQRHTVVKSFGITAPLIGLRRTVFDRARRDVRLPRHYFASNALGNGIPITDGAEWRGPKSIEETYRTYRHPMPGSLTKAARILDAGLWEAA
ncbi:hypothetical protein [Streptomyces narbonensis]|uniref:hypothetical protein n=1 Tax=Streptomyces narbonensis TaxID=67333 RepID=UPI003F4CEF15